MFQHKYNFCYIYQTMRKFWNYTLLFSILSFSLLLVQKSTLYKIKTKENSYTQLIEAYKEWLSLGKKMSTLLSFKLSSEQPAKEGQRAKLILEDNIGRKWLFKPDYIEGEKILNPVVRGKNAVAVYRIYKLFNIQTPRIIFLTVNINGKRMSGSIQQFIATISTLSEYPPSQISPCALDYILKTNVLDWLLANHNSSPLHFLVLSTDNYGKPNELTRVDNEAAFMLLGKDKLQSDWVAPWDKKPTLYYHWLWKDYILNKIKLNLAENISFVKFVSEFPDTFFKGIIQPEFENSGQKHSNLEYLLSRKLNLVKDIKEFYSALAKERNEPLIFHEDTDYQKIAAAITENLAREIKKLKEEILILQKSPTYPSKIDAIFSFGGFQWLSKVYDAYWEGEKKNLIPVCDTALKKLSLLITYAENKYEKMALRIYTQEIKKIYSGEPPSFHRDEINKVIGSLTPEN